MASTGTMTQRHRQPSYILPRAPELRPPKPTLAIILVFGTVASRACLDAIERLAEDLRYAHYHLPAYLSYLARQQPDDQHLGSLHPRAFLHAMENGHSIDALFMLPILQNMIEDAVDKYGCRDLVISGLDDYELKVWSRFAEKIAQPNALFSFVGPDVSNRRARVERLFEKDLARIAYEEHETSELVYSRLLGAIAERAVGPQTDRSRHEDSGFTDEEL